MNIVIDRGFGMQIKFIITDATVGSVGYKILSKLYYTTIHLIQFQQVILS